MSLHATHHGAPLVGSPLHGTTGDEEMPDGTTGTNKMGLTNQQCEASWSITDFQAAEMQPHSTGISTAKERYAPESKAAVTFTGLHQSAEMQLQNELMQQNRI